MESRTGPLESRAGPLASRAEPLESRAEPLESRAGLWSPELGLWSPELCLWRPEVGLWNPELKLKIFLGCAQASQVQRRASKASFGLAQGIPGRHRPMNKQEFPLSSTGLCSLWGRCPANTQGNCDNILPLGDLSVSKIQ